MGEPADRIVLQFRPDGGDPERVRAALEADEYRAYLRRVHGGPIAVGDTFEEFVTEGCSPPRDVTLRVTAVEGGSTLAGVTELAFEPAD